MLGNLKGLSIIKTVGIFFTAWLVVSMNVYALPIVDQSLNSVGNIGYMSNTGGNEMADNFSLAANYQIDGLSWFGMYFDLISTANTDSFLVGFYQSDSSLINEMSYSANITRTVTPFLDAFGLPVYEYDLVFPTPIFLDAGDYLLSISNSNTDFLDWFWADSLDGDFLNYFRIAAIDTWSEYSQELSLAFTLDGSERDISEVPLPATLALLLIGLLAAVVNTGRQQVASVWQRT